MLKLAIFSLATVMFITPVSGKELTLSEPLVATALVSPTCLQVEPEAGSDYVVCMQKGSTLTLVGRFAEKTEVNGVMDYWWKVELPDGSYAWVFGAYIEVERTEPKSGGEK